MTDQPQQAADFIRSKLGADFNPKIALQLGSGLGPLIDDMDVVLELSYADIPGFFVGNVAGHAGSLVFGTLNGVAVVVMKGRVHFYEGATNQDMCTPIRTLKRLGCEILFMTNASGSFHEDRGPGSLVMLTDFINMSGRNPLMGPNDDRYGPRFVSMENALDQDLRDTINKSAYEHNVELHHGVYVGVSGPMYETPAEIAMFKKMGGDLVGMSTVADIIVARHCGMKVACIAAITNWAAGLNPVHLTHEEVLENASLGATALIKLIENTISQF